MTDIRLPTRAALVDDLLDDLVDNTHHIRTGEETTHEDLRRIGLRLGKEIEVAVLARIRAHWVVIRHLPKLSQGVNPAAPAVLNDGAHLLVTEFYVGTVAPAVVDVVDHMGGFGAPGYVHEEAAPAGPGGVGDLLAADDQRWVDFVASDLVDTISEPGQFNPADLAGVAVVIFYPDNQ